MVNVNRIQPIAAARFRECVKCGDEFIPLPNKPGFANVCNECSVKNPVKEPEKPIAEVAWSGKHTVEVNIRFTDTHKAIAFNKANSRRAGFNACLPFAAKESLAGREVAGAEVIGHTYRTNLGEGRKVR